MLFGVPNWADNVNVRGGLTTFGIASEELAEGGEVTVVDR